MGFPPPLPSAHPLPLRKASEKGFVDVPAPVAAPIRRTIVLALKDFSAASPTWDCLLFERNRIPPPPRAILLGKLHWHVCEGDFGRWTFCLQTYLRLKRNSIALPFGFVCLHIAQRFAFGGSPFTFVGSSLSWCASSYWPIHSAQLTNLARKRILASFLLCFFFFFYYQPTLFLFVGHHDAVQTHEVRIK